MDLILICLGLLCLLLGLLGSFMPILPGPPLSWLGLLFLQLTTALETNLWFLIFTGALALGVTALDYYLPVLGTKKYGGSKKGVWGAILGLFFALLVPILGPFGFLIWPFIGAFIGEITAQKNQSQALKAALGSFVGFLAGTLLKLCISLGYLGIFLMQIWEHRAHFL